MVLKGIVHGNTIELEQAVGLPDGHRVVISVQADLSMPDPTGLSPLDRLKRAFGGWNDDPEGVDKFLEEVRRDRKSRRDAGLDE